MKPHPLMNLFDSMVLVPSQNRNNLESFNPTAFLASRQPCRLYSLCV